MSRKERGVLDRREGEWAVVHLGGGPLDLPGWMVPPTARDGDTLHFSASGEAEVVRLEVRVAPAEPGDGRARVADAQDRLRPGRG